MRPAVVERLIAALRQSGYAGYEEDGVNSAQRVRTRMKKLYETPYGQERFIPREIEASIRAAWRERRGHASLAYDKNAIPAEPAATAREFAATTGPLEIAA